MTHGAGPGAMRITTAVARHRPRRGAHTRASRSGRIMRVNLPVRPQDLMRARQ